MSTYYPTHRTTVPGESRDQALVRMALNCRGRAFHVLHQDVTGCWHVVTPAEPRIPMRTRRDRCECQHFAQHGYCAHLAHLLDALGELPVPPPNHLDNSRTDDFAAPRAA